MSTETAQPVELPSESPEENPPATEVKKELPQLSPPDNKGWWFHHLPDGGKHSDKLSRMDRRNYDAGERINVHCQSCPDNPLVGYLQK